MIVWKRITAMIGNVKFPNNKEVTSVVDEDFINKVMTVNNVIVTNKCKSKVDFNKLKNKKIS